jgi:hypothetical protein
LIGNEFVEIGVGVHAALTAFAVTDVDISERAGGDVAVEGLDRATELGSGLRSGEKATGRGWRDLRAGEVADEP